MNIEQIKSLSTTILAAIGGFLAGWGGTQGSFIVGNWESISGVLLAIVVLIYKAFANREDNVIKAAAGMESVEKVVIDNATKARELSKPDALVTSK